MINLLWELLLDAVILCMEGGGEHSYPNSNYYFIYSKGLEGKKNEQSLWFFCLFVLNWVSIVTTTGLYSAEWGCAHPFIFFPGLLPRNHNQWFIYSLLITTEPLFLNQNQCITWAKLFTTSLFIAHGLFFIQYDAGNKVYLEFLQTE